MHTIRSDDVRIPRHAREAVARHEDVVVLNRDRPVFVLSHPDDRDRVPASRNRGRRLREAMQILAAAALPDDRFGHDLQAIRESAGPMPVDPWGHS